MGKNGKKNCGVKLVLNGGKPEMNAATIPIQWFFSPDVIAKKPMHLVLFEQNEKESKGDYYNVCVGRRYACRVSAGTKFIQLFTPGHHRLMALVFADKDHDGNDVRSAIIEKLLEPEYKDCYERQLSWMGAENGELLDLYRRRGLLAAAVVEFSVPKELFAPKPETPFQKAIWKWVNLWYKKPPRDQCQYRERKIIAFTLKPVAWLIRFIAVSFWRLLGVAGILLAGILVLFVGYWPVKLWDMIVDIVCDGDYPESLEELKDDLGYKEWGSGRRILLAPWEICLLGLAGWGVYYFAVLWWEDVFATIICVLGGGFIAGYFSGWLYRAIRFLRSKWEAPEAAARRLEEEKKKKEKRLAKAAADKAQWEKAYQQWLAENCGFEKNAGAVNLFKAPAPLGSGQQAVQLFTIGFWALKAKICRPYSR